MATDLKQMQNHHIVPDYWCKELGLTTSYKVDGKEFYFKENLVRTTRKQHSLIHWGYYCGDLSLLLEVCSPEQWVLDMIPLGDNRDVGSAQYIALGEVEGIDTSGENNPHWKGGVSLDSVKYQKDIYLNNKELCVKLMKEGLSFYELPKSMLKCVPYSLLPQEEKDRRNILCTVRRKHHKKNNTIKYQEQLERQRKWAKNHREEKRAYDKERYSKKTKEEKIKSNALLRERYDPVKRKEMYERKKLERATATLDKSSVT